MSLKNDLQNIYNVKNDIKIAIENKLSDSIDLNFVNYPNYINNISGGSSGDVNWNEYYIIPGTSFMLNNLYHCIKKIPDELTQNIYYIYAANNMNNIIINAPNVHSLSNFIPLNQANSFNADIDNWTLGTINNLYLAFYGHSYRNVIDKFKKFDYSNVTNLQSAFMAAAIDNCDIFKNSIPIAGSTNIDLQNAFAKSYVRTLDGLENILINKEINNSYALSYTFDSTSYLGNIEALYYLNFNVNTLYLSSTFNYAGYYSNLSNFEAITNWNVNNIIYNKTFTSTNLNTLEVLPISNSTFSYGTFLGTKLTSLNGLSRQKSINLCESNALFAGCRYLSDVNDLDNVTNVTGYYNGIRLTDIFYECSNLTNLDPLGNMMNKCNLYSTELSGAFDSCTNLSNFTFLNNVIYNTGLNYTRTFQRCENIQNLDTFPNFKNISSGNYMFAYCYNLTNISNLKYNHLNFAQAMFKKCRKLTGFVSLPNISVRDISHMFEDCYNITRVDLSIDDYVYSANIRYTFANCSNLRYVTTTYGGVIGSAFNYESSYAFYECINLQTANIGININQYPSSISTDAMFYNCSNLTDISKIKLGTPNINYLMHWNSMSYPGTYDGPNYAYMFYNCSNITSLNALQLFNINTSWDKYAQWYKAVRVYGDEQGMGYGSDYTGPLTGIFKSCTNLSNASLNSIAALLSNIQVLPSASESLEPKDLPCTLGTINVIHRTTYWEEDWETGEYREVSYDTPIVNYGLGLTSNQINYIINNSGYWTQLQNKGWSNNIGSIVFESYGM